VWTRWLTASPVAKTCIRTLMNINLQMFLPRVLPTSFFFCGARARTGIRPPLFDVSRSHSIRQTHGRTHVNGWPTPLRGRNLHKTQNRHERRMSLPSAGFEPAIPAVKRLKTYPFDRTTTRICCPHHISTEISNLLHLNSVCWPASPSLSSCTNHDRPCCPVSNTLLFVINIFYFVCK